MNAVYTNIFSTLLWLVHLRKRRTKVPEAQGKFRADELEPRLFLRIKTDLRDHLLGLRAGLASRLKLCARVLVVQESQDRRVIPRLMARIPKLASHHPLPSLAAPLGLREMLPVMQELRDHPVVVHVKARMASRVSAHPLLLLAIQLGLARELLRVTHHEVLPPHKLEILLLRLRMRVISPRHLLDLPVLAFTVTHHPRPVREAPRQALIGRLTRPTR